MNKILFLISVALGAFASEASDFNYSKGILIVNEDWYGHQNSSINYLEPENPNGEYWHYRVIREENPGMELGCTNQFATIFNGKLYCIAKQAKDPGATVDGGRITVCDASTMKIIHQQDFIDPSGKQCDGRAFVGVNEHKGYVSSSNGIWIYDLDSFEIKGMIEGSANPFAGGDNDKPNTDPTGALYFGQTGVMICTNGKVFAAHQQYGLLVIDVETDSVVDVISMEIVQAKAGIGSLVQSTDGNIWCSVAKSTNGLGSALDYLVKVNPNTLEYEVIQLPDNIYGPLNSWYAWTPDPFISSPNKNCLFWKGGNNTWFSGVWIYRFDIDNNEFSLFIDLSDDPEDWKLYGCSIGIDPKNNDIYMSLFHQFGKPEYMVRRYSSEGQILQEYPMIENYWFPSIFLFPNDKEASVTENVIRNYSGMKFKNGVLIYNISNLDEIMIYDFSGRLVMTQPIDKSSNSISLSLPKGFYFIKGAQETLKIKI